MESKREEGSTPKGGEEKSSKVRKKAFKDKKTTSSNSKTLGKRRVENLGFMGQRHQGAN